MHISPASAHHETRLSAQMPQHASILIVSRAGGTPNRRKITTGPREARPFEGLGHQALSADSQGKAASGLVRHKTLTGVPSPNVSATAIVNFRRCAGPSSPPPPRNASAAGNLNFAMASRTSCVQARFMLSQLR